MERMIVMSKMILLIFTSSILLVFVGSGCVSSQKYNDLEIQYAAMEQEIDQAKEENASLARQKEEQERIMNEIIDKLRDEVSNKSIQIAMLEEQLTLTIVDTLFFASGYAEVNSVGRDILSRLAPTLKDAIDQEIRVVGHTDSVPIGKKLSAKYLSNWELSTARATSIIQILQWGYGIDPERLVAEGVAHYRPMVMETNENRASNRVVEIILKTMTVK